MKSRRLVPCTLCTRSCTLPVPKMLLGPPVRWKKSLSTLTGRWRRVDRGYSQKLWCLRSGCGATGRIHASLTANSAKYWGILV